jgi:hypothetical protein
VTGLDCRRGLRFFSSPSASGPGRGPRVLLKGPASLNNFAKEVHGIILGLQGLRGIINAEKRLWGPTQCPVQQLFSDGGARVLFKGSASLNNFAKGVRGISLVFQLLHGIINAEKRLLGPI